MNIGLSQNRHLHLKFTMNTIMPNTNTLPAVAYNDSFFLFNHFKLFGEQHGN